MPPKIVPYKSGEGYEDAENGMSGYNPNIIDSYSLDVLEKEPPIFVKGNPLLDEFLGNTEKKGVDLTKDQKYLRNKLKALDKYRNSLKKKEEKYKQIEKEKDMLLKKIPVDSEAPSKGKPTLVKQQEEEKDSTGIAKELARFGIGLNEEKDGPPQGDWGHYVYFEGGKKSRRKRKKTKKSKTKRRRKSRKM
jgi:hypothetical protein